jgi:hypothetical protein
MFLGPRVSIEEDKKWVGLIKNSNLSSVSNIQRRKKENVCRIYKRHGAQELGPAAIHIRTTSIDAV